jgi:beta-N-acetylhexosaminidase
MLNEVGSTSTACRCSTSGSRARRDIVGDRALGSNPMQVAALGRAILDGLHRPACSA